MNGPYNIPNLENQGKEVGTINQPFVYQITSGQKHGKSLIYHAQIRKRYYRYTFKSCSSENLHLGCKNRSCKAVAFCKIPTSSCLIVEKPTKRSNGKRLVKQYTLKFDDPRLRDLSEYIFLPKNSPEHTCTTQPLSLGPQYDFREAHCNQGLRCKKLQFDEVLQTSNLIPEYGVQIAATITGKRKTESKRFYRRLDRFRGQEILGS